MKTEKINITASELKRFAAEGKKDSSDCKRHFSQLYNEYSNTVFLYARGRGLTEEDSQDIVHDVFMAVINKIEKYDEKRRFFPWFWGFVLNYIKQRQNYNAKKQHESLNDTNDNNISRIDLVSDVTIDTEMETIASLFRLSMEEILENFSSFQRQIIYLAFFQEYKNKEIADLVGRSQNDVAVEKRRALQRLRDILEKNGIDRSYLQK